jgi:hypothetical protein
MHFHFPPTTISFLSTLYLVSSVSYAITSIPHQNSIFVKKQKNRIEEKQIPALRGHRNCVLHDLLSTTSLMVKYPVCRGSRNHETLRIGADKRDGNSRFPMKTQKKIFSQTKQSAFLFQLKSHRKLSVALCVWDSTHIFFDFTNTSCESLNTFGSVVDVGQSKRVWIVRKGWKTTKWRERDGREAENSPFSHRFQFIVGLLRDLMRNFGMETRSFGMKTRKIEMKIEENEENLASQASASVPKLSPSHSNLKRIQPN